MCSTAHIGINAIDGYHTDVPNMIFWEAASGSRNLWRSYYLNAVNFNFYLFVECQNIRTSIGISSASWSLMTSTRTGVASAID